MRKSCCVLGKWLGQTRSTIIFFSASKINYFTIRYAAMNMGQEVKQALITVKRELVLIKTLEELIPVAQNIRGLISVRVI